MDCGPAPITGANPVERPYLDLLRRVLAEGDRVPTRAVIGSTGEQAEAVSVFGEQMRIDLGLGFPAVTTKRLAFGAVATELAWFLRGDTNVRYLRERGVRIWDEWAGPDGELGPTYGQQWRAWPGPFGPVDQLAALMVGIRAARDDPASPYRRRLVLSAWNVPFLGLMALPPCHVLAQFSVRPGGRLFCHLYMRSADLFLGVPFNVASYALLTHILAGQCGLGVGDLAVSFGDAHVYANHLVAVARQLAREPFPPPRLELDPAVTVDSFGPEMARLDGYECHPPIPGEVAI